MRKNDNKSRARKGRDTRKERGGEKHDNAERMKRTKTVRRKKRVTHEKARRENAGNNSETRDSNEV